MTAPLARLTRGTGSTTKWWVLVICLPGALTPCCTSTVPNDERIKPPAVVLADLDFEKTDILPWEGQYNEGNFLILTDADRERNQYGKFLLGEGGDYWISPANGSQTARSEIQLLNSGAIDTRMTYGWDFKIGADYIESDDWQIIGQFHDQPDTAIGETWADYPTHSPPLAIKYRQGTIIIAVYSWETNSVMDIATLNVEKDAWNTLALNVYWSVTGEGTIEAWLNGVPFTAGDGQTVYRARNCFNKACNYLKIGLYRSNAIMTKGIVYFDNIKSGIAVD